MKLKRVSFFLVGLHLSIFGFEKESLLPLDLKFKNPTYKNGKIFTNDGGIIKGDNFWIQSKKLSYTKKETGSEIIEAEQDFVLNYEGKIFLGDRIYFDVLARKGVIENGKIFIHNFSIFCKKITLNDDKTLDLYDVMVTTSSDDNIFWKMDSSHIHLERDLSFFTKNVKFKVKEITLFWIPYFKNTLAQSDKSKDNSKLSYNLTWDAGQGPRFSLRYNIYSWMGLDLFLRGDYRWNRGPGAAFEVDYLSLDKKSVFKSKNYISNDTYFNDDNPNKRLKRFRIQGELNTSTENKEGTLLVVWDKMSDKNMPTDFSSDDFEVNPLKQNKLMGRYYHKNYVTGVDILPRMNSFEGLKQEIPSLFFSVAPITFGSRAPITFFNNFRLQFLDYVYSSDLKYAPDQAQNILRDFHSLRAESEQEIQASFIFSFLKFSPSIGFNGILYNNNPFKRSVNQAIFKYNATLESDFYKNYSSLTHSIHPYIKFRGITKPLQPLQKVYIFDIKDGYYSLNFLRAGIKSAWESSKKNSSYFSLDPYLLAFFFDKTYQLAIPKIGIEGTYVLDHMKLTPDLRWNLNNNILDFFNVELEYTYSANLSFSIEYRYRGPYDFRKADHDNFILDVARPIEDLYHSPLSDKRNTLLTKAELYFTPKTKLQLELHSGWGRSDQPGYTEARANFLTMLSSSWKVNLSYTYTTRGSSHFGFKIDLIN